VSRGIGYQHRATCDLAGLQFAANRPTSIFSSPAGGGAVLAYGSDADVRAAFSDFNITDFDLHTIDVPRLRYESAERGLLREALTRALARARHMDVVYGRTTRTRRALSLTPFALRPSHLMARGR
jgi:hypothetical protein